MIHFLIQFITVINLADLLNIGTFSKLKWEIITDLILYALVKS